MSEIKNQFLKKLTELVPYDYEEVVLGTLGLNINYISTGNSANPLDFDLKQPFENSSIDNSFKCLYSTNTELRHIFTKRILKTSFYLNYLIVNGFPLYILDFYTWMPTPIIYRIFLFQFSKDDSTFILSLPENHIPAADRLYKIGTCYFNYYVEGKADPGSDHILIESDENADDNALLILAYSSDDEAVKNLDPSNVLKQYKENESISRNNHILHSLVVQDTQILGTLDTLWSRVKIFSPERRPDAHMMDLIDRDQQYGFVVKEICGFFGWNHLLENIPDYPSTPDTENAGYVADKLDTILSYYQNDDFQNEIHLSTLLQKWWDRYSLPLFQKKFELMFRNYPQKIFIIFALAQWLRLPWSLLLLNKCNQFKKNPEFEFLSYLYQLLQIKIIRNKVVCVKTGTRNPGNFIQINRGNKFIRFTRFGQKIYSSLSIDKLLVIKVDKEVFLKFDEENHKLEVLPDVSGYLYDNLHINKIILRVDNYLLHVPLLWKKSEIHHKDLRLKWILKKKRFQISCAKGQIDGRVELNDQKLEFNQSRWLKIYQSIKSTNPRIGLSVLDREGRSYFLTNKKSQECWVIGWIQNHYGLLVDRCNFKTENGRQWLLSGSESGRIEESVILFDGSGSCMVNIKNYLAIIELRYLENSQLSKILLYSPSENKGHLLAVIDDVIYHKNDIIAELFIKSLGFCPLLLSSETYKTYQSVNPVILVKEENAKPASLRNELNQLSTTYTLGFNENMEEIFTDILPL